MGASLGTRRGGRLRVGTIALVTDAANAHLVCCSPPPPSIRPHVLVAVKLVAFACLLVAFAYVLELLPRAHAGDLVSNAKNIATTDALQAKQNLPMATKQNLPRLRLSLSASPTQAPTQVPTAAPTSTPTKAPSQVPSAAPTDAQHACFNRFSAIWSASEIGPSESDCEAAVMDGTAPQLRNVAKKLRQGECLNIVALGGSITAGHGIAPMNHVCSWRSEVLQPACAALCALPLHKNDAWVKLRCSDSVGGTLNVRRTLSSSLPVRNWARSPRALRHSLCPLNIAPPTRTPSFNNRHHQCANLCEHASVWWNMLEQALALQMPCVHRYQHTNETNEPSGHNFSIHAGSGKGSSWWIDKLQNDETLRSDVRRADLVLFDTAVNDEYVNTFRTEQTETETLVWMVERLAPDAMKMWVTVGWREFDRAEHAEPEQREVLAAYGIPQISLSKGLLVPRNCALEASNSSTRATTSACTTFKPGFTKKYIILNRGNCCHPGELGSQLSATFIARYLMRLRDEEAAGTPALFPRTPRWVDAGRLKMALRTKSVIVDLELTTKSALLDEHVLKHDGFEVYEDAKGKPGLIATAVGAQFIAGFHMDIPRGAPVIVTVTLLSTYADVGVATLMLQTKKTKEGTDQWVTRVSKAVDCMWDWHGSEPTVHKFEWTPTGVAFISSQVRLDAMEGRVVVEVGLRASQSGGTKVKIYSIGVSTFFK